MNKYFKIFWGVALVLHPFILRFTEYATRVIGGRITGNIYNWIQKDAKLFEKMELMRAGKDSFFLFVCLLSFIAFRGSEGLSRKYLVPIISLVVLTYFNTYDFLSPAVWEQSLFFMMGLALVSHLYSCINLKDVDFYTNCLGLSCLLGSLFALLEYFGVDAYDLYASFYGISNSYDGEIVKGVLSNPNPSAAYIALTAPCLMKRKWLMVVPVIALYLLGSMMGYLTLLAFFLYYFYSKFFTARLVPYVLAVLALLICSVVFYTEYHGGVDSGRFYMWKEALIKLDVNPLFGNGLGFVHDKFPPLANLNGAVFRNMHNELLSLFYSHGVIGLGLVGCLLINPIRKGGVFFASLVFAFFINSLGNFPFHITPLFTVFAFYFVFLLKESEGNYV